MVSLFPGFGYAAGYKVLQRIYKFGGQPYFNDLIASRYKTNLKHEHVWREEREDDDASNSREFDGDR